MAYTKNIWACGDEITAEKLNHIEEGIDGLDIPVFNYTEDPVTACADMHTFAMANENKPFYIFDDTYGLVRTIVECIADPESNFFEVVALVYDGGELTLYRYAPDGEHPEIVNRGEYTIWEKQ